jgi:maltooligosyltrehalose trehalohydrolase
MKPNRPSQRRCGAIPLGDETLGWRVWAPLAERADLVLQTGQQRREIPMQRASGGYFVHIEGNVQEGQRYAFRLNGGPERPDPCSLWQPDGVHAASAVVRPEHFSWNDHSWLGVSREDLVFYELHVGTFTPEGTFAGIIPRLAALRELGVTAVEIMPVAQFPGTRNWGYDGVSLYAAQNSYGGPHGLQRLVDACHGVGLAIFLDVVYNHFGPEGNYLAEFGPYFTDRYQTPWGRAVNFDGRGCDAVRDFVLDNVRMWLEDFHLDGLRLDAVHAVYDLGAHHILRAIKEVADEVSQRTGRTIHIIAESDLNDPRLLQSPEQGGAGLDAQWSDDFHHAIHTYLTGERRGYYEDFGTIGQIAEVFQEPFLYAWKYSPFRGRKHGARPPAEWPGERFVVCLQNHDQIGNRARGERLSTLLDSPAKQRLAASMLLLSPYLPLLFMGEEYGEENPFPFFCSFEDSQLVQAVREGRKREFAEFAWQGEIPDPQAEETFRAARLAWSWPEGTIHANLRRLYQDLLKMRKRLSALRDFQRNPAHLLPDPENGPVVRLLRGPLQGEKVQVFFNLDGQPQSLPGVPHQGQKLLFSSEAPPYGGNRQESSFLGQLLPYECIILGPQV